MCIVIINVLVNMCREMDAILALGQFRLLAVEDTVGDILIEVHQIPNPFTDKRSL